MAKGKKKSNKAKNPQANQGQQATKPAEQQQKEAKKAPVAATRSGISSGNSASTKAAPKAKAPKERPEYHPILSAENLRWVGIGTIVLVVGYLLMIGGKSPDPNVFDDKKIYSFTRISLAPILICVGFGLQMYGILIKAPRARRSEGE